MASSEGSALDQQAPPLKDEDIVIEGYLRVRANHGFAGLRSW
jgi:hypothetical protein